MNRFSMVICVFDEIYLSSLEIGLLKGLGDKSEIMLITNREYFDWFFGKPQKIDVLIIEEELYEETIQRHNIGTVFILQEEAESRQFKDGAVSLFKYSSVKEIYYKILGRLGEKIKDNDENTDKTEIILVYSPVGGSGKTTTALNICSELADYNKKVLYLNIESVQSFHWFLRNREYVDEMFMQELSVQGKGILSNLINYTGNEEFDYIKPVQGALITYGVEKNDYVNFIKILAEEKIYEYIVVDTGGELDESNLMIMGMCDKVLMVLNQDALSVWKCESVLENLDYSDEGKFLFICNRFEATDRNYIIESEFLSNAMVTQYVEENQECLNQKQISQMRGLHIFKDTAMLIL